MMNWYWKLLTLDFDFLHRRIMFSSWDKVHNFLDTMDISGARSSLTVSSSSSSSTSSSHPNRRSLSIGTRSWLVGDKTAQQIVGVIQPTLASEFTRKEVFEYLQRLIESNFGTKVLVCGSVPLKTYLPHGDIDMTIIYHYGTSEDIAAAICTFLEYEKDNPTFQVRDVVCIPAQVRVVKCIVRGIHVDISFNQTAGLYALYFLEQVDQFIGKDHLFKLSIILIKAWCYYESRLLGGSHCLISSYALEILVLHIINHFHSSLRCPLAVMYKFLEYYGNFDWENYGVAFNGLVVLSAAPKLVVVPLPDCDKLLLTKEFLWRSRDGILHTIGAMGTQGSDFPVKFLNILDPLKDDNNLGRNVNKGNFVRIKTALSYGAQMLSEVLVLPPDEIQAGVECFFKNTLDINGKGKRVDVAISVPLYGFRSSATKTVNNNLLFGIDYGMWFDDYDTHIMWAPRH